MRLIDKVAINRLLHSIIDLIWMIIKTFAPQKPTEENKPDKRWKPRWRKKENE